MDCLTRCQWMEFSDVEEARAEKVKMINGEESRVLSDCVTCFACEEYCPYDSHPFDLITELQEKYNSLNINPGIIESTVNRFAPHDQLRLKEIDPNKPVLNKCGLRKINAKNMEGQLFENLQYVSGLDFFCNLMYHHYGRDSVIKERAPIILENIKAQGIKEMICFHDECYGFYASFCPRNNIELPPGFKPVHIYEYLYNYLKEHESTVKKLGMKIAYQRSCSNRFLPEVEEWVDKICTLIGVERVEREYDRENALCCGGIFATLGKKALGRTTQNDNINDMIKHEAEACVYNCSMCMESLGSKVGRKGLKNYILSDLCRLALGESID
ncbi:MAG: (Fe-S)-binding protein [Candidatus Lokiarchaeota archaeon]|nr:(Fe-S)-binding protein [Candidatus Lokiarchaeota archaeon]